MQSTDNTYNSIDKELVHGGDVYRNKVELDYSVNLNPLTLPESIVDAALRGLAEMHQYPDPVQQRLREEIALYENVAPENVICASGASQLLMAVCHAARPGRALITAPCYAGYSRALRAVDAAVREYPLNVDAGFELDEGFLGKLTEDIDIVFIADPNNPDGKLIDPDLKCRIAEKCREKGITLVIDECFLPLTDRGLERQSFNDGALHLRAFTKTFAIPGIRIGYMISDDAEALRRISLNLPEWNVSRIAERTGEAAARVLRETDYLERSIRMISEEREYLIGELRGLGIRVFHSDTNYLLIKTWPDLYDRLLGKGIMIRRCANFTGLDDTFFRIAVRRHEDNERLIAALRELI